MNVEDLVQERIAAARRKIANDKRRRQELADARRHGIAARHRQKLAHLSQYTPAPTREAASSKKPPSSGKLPDSNGNRRDTPTAVAPSKGAANDSPPSGGPAATP